jgi:ribonucrease Y
MDESIIIIMSGVVAISGFFISLWLGKKVANTKILEAEVKAKSITVDADKEAEAIKKEKLQDVKEEWQRKRKEFDSEIQSRKSKLTNKEKDFKQREIGVEKKLDMILGKERKLQQTQEDLEYKEQDLTERETKADNMFEDQVRKLEEIASITKEEAKNRLIDEMKDEARKQAANIITRIRSEAKEKAGRESQNIIVAAIQRSASDHAMESTVTSVDLESDEMKGRIIGKEGRNIRAFESATGIDLIIDDTPDAVLISGFDPFRREVAKKALEWLMTDGRIHPTRIEELVNKAEKELTDDMVKMGEEALINLDIHGMKPELMQLVGRMRYRTSYGQNLLNHSVEVANLAGIMASQLGLNVKFAKRAALLHDIGKVAGKEMEGPHALLGMELTKKFGEHPVIVNAVGAHHEDVEMETAIAVLVQSADSISGARPGARRESLENYVKRLENLEAIANEWSGVEKTYCIQAGREIRVIVEPNKINDQAADEMAMGIAERVEAEMEYPGQIRVTVIREKRSVGIAK